METLGSLKTSFGDLPFPNVVPASTDVVAGGKLSVAGWLFIYWKQS